MFYAINITYSGGKEICAGEHLSSGQPGTTAMWSGAGTLYTLFSDAFSQRVERTSSVDGRQCKENSGSNRVVLVETR
jgi:hypothetical protein